MPYNLLFNNSKAFCYSKLLLCKDRILPQWYMYRKFLLSDFAAQRNIFSGFESEYQTIISVLSLFSTHRKSQLASSQRVLSDIVIG